MTQLSATTPRPIRIIAEATALTLLGSDLATSIEMELRHAAGEFPHPDGGIATSVLLDAFTGSISLIEDKNGNIWLAWWKPGQETGRIRQIGIGDDPDALADFCVGLLQEFYFRE